MTGSDGPEAREVLPYSKEYDLERGVEEIITQTDSVLSGIEVGDDNRLAVIALAGASSTGKSHKISNAVVERYQGRGIGVIVLSLDNYSIPKSDLTEGVYYDDPEAYEIDRLVSDIAELRDGRAITRPVWNRNARERLEPDTVVDPINKRVIIVEGLFGLSPRIEREADVKVFVDAADLDGKLDLHGRMIRRIKRDIVDGEVHEEDPSAQFWYLGEVTNKKYWQYVHPTREYADIIIHNDYQPAIEKLGSAPRQIQAKYRINDEVSLDLFKQRLADEIEARPLDEDVRQVDSYRAPDGVDIGDRGEAVIIRASAGKVRFCYKGPSVDGSKFSDRQVAEFDIWGPESEGIINECWPVHVLDVEKDSSTFTLGDITVSIDAVKVKRPSDESVFMGRYVELRSNDGNHAKLDEASQRISNLGMTGLLRAGSYFDEAEELIT